MITINDLPISLQSLAYSLANDETDDLLIIFTLIGALSSVAGHLVDEYSQYQPDIYTSSPITVSHIIIADSGAGKSRICKQIFSGIHTAIDEKIPVYNKAMKEYRVKLKKINSSFTVKKDEFTSEPDLMPDEPVSPNFIIEDFTIESLSRMYHIGSKFLTIFSEEGGNVISSRAFGTKSINTTLSFFNKIMCGERAVITTVKDGQRILVNRRLTLLLLMQDSFFNDFISKADTQACSGTYQRIFPIRVANKRKLMKNKTFKTKKIGLLKESQLLVNLGKLPYSVNKNGILSPPLISKSNEAHKLWLEYYAEQNDFCATYPENETVSYRLRNVETASRYAALFQISDNFYLGKKLVDQISIENMTKAIKICKYGLQRQIVEFVYNDEQREKIYKTFEYIKSKKIATRLDLMRNLPRNCRSMKDVDNTLLFLITEGYAEQSAKGFLLTGKELS